MLLSYRPGTAEDRVADGVRFKGQENFISLCRFPDGGGWWGASNPTRNTPNTAWRNGLVVNEIMYHPLDPNPATNNTWDEYVEVLNPTSTAITLADTNGAWRLSGGINYVFPTGTALPAGATLLVVNFDPTNSAALTSFRATYNLTNGSPIFGPYQRKPGQPQRSGGH